MYYFCCKMMVFMKQALWDLFEKPQSSAAAKIMSLARSPLHCHDCHADDANGVAVVLVTLNEIAPSFTTYI